MNSIIRMIKSVNLNSNVIGLMIVLFIAVITGIAIAETKWIYFGVVLIPFLLYFCVAKPFILPFGLYVFLIPFDTVLSIADNSDGATLTKLMGVLTILVLLVKGAIENKLKKPDATLIWWVLFVIYGALSIWWAVNPKIVISTTLIGLLVLYLVTSSYKIQKSEFEMLKWCILWGGVLAAIFAIYNYQSIEIVKRTSLQAGSRTASIGPFAFSLLIPISICVEKILKENRKIIKGLLCGVLSVIIFCLIITAARGAHLGIAAIFIVYIISMKQRVTYVTIFIIIGIVLSSFLPSLFVERWSAALETGGSGRIDIWYVGLLCLKEYWPIGAGLNNFLFVYPEFAIYATQFRGYGRGAHNIYLKFFVELGIIGFSLLIMAIMKHYQAIRSRYFYDNSNQIMLKAAFWAVLVYSFFLDSLYYKSFWLIWMLIMMHKNVLETENISGSI